MCPAPDATITFACHPGERRSGQGGPHNMDGACDNPIQPTFSGSVSVAVTVQAARIGLQQGIRYRVSSDEASTSRSQTTPSPLSPAMTSRILPSPAISISAVAVQWQRNCATLTTLSDVLPTASSKNASPFPVTANTGVDSTPHDCQAWTGSFASRGTTWADDAERRTSCPSWMTKK